MAWPYNNVKLPGQNILTVNGISQTITEWTTQFGLTLNDVTASIPVIRERIRTGWPVDRALTAPRYAKISDLLFEGPQPTSKCCGHCGVDQPLSSFNKNATRKDGLAGNCRQCAAAKLRMFHHSLSEDAKEKYRQSWAEYYRRPGQAQIAIERTKSWRKSPQAATPERIARRKETQNAWRRIPENAAKQRLANRLARERKHGKGVEVSAKRQEIYARYCANNPEKEKARDATKSALRHGLLVKQPCEVCGSPRSEAHHTDYSNPLAIRWLCKTHHWEIHRKY